MSAGVAIVGCGLIGQKRAKALAGARLVACTICGAKVQARLPAPLGVFAFQHVGVHPFFELELL